MWRSLVPATCYLVCGGTATYVVYVCLLFQDDPWFLVGWPFNTTKFRELGTAWDTTSRGGWRFYLAAFRNAVRFEIGRVCHRARDRSRRTYHAIRVVSERGRTKQPKEITNVVEEPSRWSRRQARRKYELYYANLRRKKTHASCSFFFNASDLATFV